MHCAAVESVCVSHVNGPITAVLEQFAAVVHAVTRLIFVPDFSKSNHVNFFHSFK